MGGGSKNDKYAYFIINGSNKSTPSCAPKSSCMLQEQMWRHVSIVRSAQHEGASSDCSSNTCTTKLFEEPCRFYLDCDAPPIFRVVKWVRGMDYRV